MLRNKSMRKVIFLVTQSEFGGAQRYIFEMVSNLDRNRYDVSVAAGEGDGELFKRLKNTQTQTIHLKRMRRAPWPLQAILSGIETLNLLKKERPDILFLCSTTAGLIGSIAALLYRLQVSSFKFQVIYRIGGWAFRDPRPFFTNKLIFWAEKITCPLKDKIIVNSEIDREIAIKNKICPSEKIVKIYNGIDVEKLEFWPRHDAIKKLSQFGNLTIEQFNNSTIVGTVANFYKTKGLKYLIEAAHILNTGFKFQVSSFKILIIGEGNQRPQFESLIKKYELENKVFLLGRIPEAFKYLKALDIFVLPSLKEGFPWIILEAMTSQVPIISTNVGAISEIIESEKEGILVESKNPKILAEKILDLIKNPEKSQRLKNQARERVKEFSLQKMIEDTEKLF